MCFPDSLGAGKSIFAVNEANTVFKQQLALECRVATAGIPPGPPILGGIQGTVGVPGQDWPASVDLKAYWQKLD